MATFGERLRHLREEKNLKQTELAKLLNLESSSTISQYENINRIPDAYILQRLAEIFDCSVDYLLGRTGIKDPVDAIVTRQDYEVFAAHSLSNYENMPEDIKDQVRKYAEFLWKEYEEKKKGGK
ncbi:MAG TPA: helix-turn-helix transcriptional regulator [Firmicutes bacterium]|nr:helix-turn-helix transcriptional regulator [Bacillota bacterium]